MGSKKLLPRYVGPFPVKEKIGEVAYRLQLLNTMKMHDVFHVSLLRPYYSNGVVAPPPPPIVIDGEEESEVEQILDHKPPGRRTSRTRYLVKWVGYDSSGNDWIAESNLLPNASEILEEYWEQPRRVQKRARSRRG